MQQRSAPRAHPRGTQDGFGFIEVVVAMFLLGLIALAIVPLLVQGLRLSTNNGRIAAATQLANQQIEQVRGVTSCGGVTPTTSSIATQGVTLKATRTVGTSCPATGYPITVRVSVTVVRTDTNATLTTANSLVFVAGP